MSPVSSNTHAAIIRHGTPSAIHSLSHRGPFIPCKRVALQPTRCRSLAVVTSPIDTMTARIKGIGCTPGFSAAWTHPPPVSGCVSVPFRTGRITLTGAQLCESGMDSATVARSGPFASWPEIRHNLIPHRSASWIFRTSRAPCIPPVCDREQRRADRVVTVRDVGSGAVSRTKCC